MRTVLILLGIWLLINLLFVVLMTPPRKPRRQEGAVAPGSVNQSAYPFDEEETTSLRHVIVSLGIGTFFVLVPVIVDAMEDIKRAFQRNPPTE